MRLDHVVVPVHDAAAARVFYEHVLGLPLVTAFTGDDWGGQPWLMMVFGFGAGGQHLVATALANVHAAPPSPYPRDARHHAVAVESGAWESHRARLEAAGADFWVEEHGAQRSIYVVDPSGNVLELTTPDTPPFVVAAGAGAVIDAWVAEHG